MVLVALSYIVLEYVNLPEPMTNSNFIAGAGKSVMTFAFS